MKVWVTRDKNKATHSEVCVWEGKESPVCQADGYYDYPVTSRTCRVVDEFENIDATHFKRLFDFTPRKGSCQQYNLTLTKI